MSLITVRDTEGQVHLIHTSQLPNPSPSAVAWRGVWERVDRPTQAAQDDQSRKETR